ncbi:MAG: patatin-like phospholipase family protein [Anaerolineae bacterium]
MIAFVLSGGGNRGALQVGAVQALLSRGIVPDILVGTSVGALNAAYLAHNPSLATAQKLERLWGEVTNDDIYPGGPIAILWRLLRVRTSLFPNDSLYQFLCRHMPPGIGTFADLTSTELYIVATELETGQMHVFGERSTDRVVDAIMASTALPPLHPPWCVEGECYVDGGAVSDLPLRVAVEKEARTIYALHLPAPLDPFPLPHSLADVANRAFSALMQQQVTLDFEKAARARGVTLHHIKLCPPSHLALSVRDFSQSAKLISIGREQTERYLETQRTRPVSRRERLAHMVRKTAAQARTAIHRTIAQTHAAVNRMSLQVHEQVSLDSRRQPKADGSSFKGGSAVGGQSSAVASEVSLTINGR